MLKFFFFCLLIANVVLYSLGRGYFSSPLMESHQPQRLLEQQNSTQLKLISAEVATAPEPPPAPIEAPKPEMYVCLQYGEFPTADVNQIESKLKPINFGNRQSRQNVQDVTNHIVFIPPMGGKEQADKKAVELTHLGIRDFFIIQDQSNLRWGISLGVFKTEDAAKQLLASLTAKGVHSAKLGVRMVATNKVFYQFKNVNAAEKVELEKLKAVYPNLDLVGCK